MRMSINWVHWSVWLATLTKFPWHQALREGAPWKQSKQAETHDELAIVKNWKPCGAYAAAKERDAAEILSYFGEPPAPRLRGSLASLQEGSFGWAMEQWLLQQYGFGLYSFLNVFPYHGGTHHLWLFALAGIPSKRQHLCQALCMCCAWGWIEDRIRQFRDGATDYNLKYPANVCWFKRVGGTGRQKKCWLVELLSKELQEEPSREEPHTHAHTHTYMI